MDQNQKAIIAKIRTLEGKLESADNRKVKIGSLMGIGVAAIGTAATIWYSPETLIESISYAPLLVGNAVLALGAGVGSAKLTNGKKEVKADLAKAFVERIDNQLELLKNREAGSKIDFIFNIESSLYPKVEAKDLDSAKKNQNDILPLNMANYYEKIGYIFSNLFEKDVEDRPLIERIELKNAEMTDEQFQYLLSFSLGCCGTKILDLSKNKLTALSVQALHNHIVNKKKGFEQLKSLNLSDNNLSNLSLDLIVQIVNYLNLEELDLSGNFLNGDKKGDKNIFDGKLQDFLTNQAQTMPSLKVFKIANIGLTDNFSKTISEMIIEPSVLTYLDISHNPNLSARKIKNILNNGFGLNQSIQEFLIDKAEVLHVSNITAKKNNIYTNMYINSRTKEDEKLPRFIYLLNQFGICQKQKIDIKDCLHPLVYEQLESISTAIMHLRIEQFGIEEDYSIPITEKEFILFRNKDLEDYYAQASKSQDMNELSPRLFKQEEEFEKELMAPSNAFLIQSVEEIDAQKIKLMRKVQLGLLKTFPVK